MSTRNGRIRRNKPEVVAYTVITGGYDLVPDIKPERGISYWLFTDDPEIPAASFWNRSVLPNPLGLSQRRLSRLPKLRPHFYLPPHDISVYMDANITLIAPVRDFAVQCVQKMSIAAHPHPNTTCTYDEAEKCARLGLDEWPTVQAHMERYRRDQFPPKLGLTENSFIIRRNDKKARQFNDLWHLEYFSGSQRDQLSFMYCLWRLKLACYFIWQYARVNSYFKRSDHASSPRINQKNTTKRPETENGVGNLIEMLPSRTEMLFVGKSNRELIRKLASSGKLARLYLADPTVGSNGKKPNDSFESIQRSYPDVLARLPGSGANLGDQVPDRSMDLVYLGHAKSGAQLQKEMAMWRRKIRNGGLLGGAHYGDLFPDLSEAINRSIGKPGWVFSDNSWLLQFRKDSFGIVSYCSLNYLDAYEFSIDSWLENGLADEVVIFTDTPEFQQRARQRDRVQFVQLFDVPITKFEKIPWRRKIEAIQAYYKRTSQPFFCYLDCDCWVHHEFSEVFRSMSEVHIAGTRLLRRDQRGKGEANAGVIFFNHQPALAEFFKLWDARAQIYYEKNHDEYYEQDSLSHLILESFDGLHSFRSTLFSECLYNVEDDSDGNWLNRIRHYQPKIIHFKAKRFRDEALRQTVAALLKESSTIKVDKR